MTNNDNQPVTTADLVSTSSTLPPWRHRRPASALSVEYVKGVLKGNIEAHRNLSPVCSTLVSSMICAGRTRAQAKRVIRAAFQALQQMKTIAEEDIPEAMAETEDEARSRLGDRDYVKSRWRMIHTSPRCGILTGGCVLTIDHGDWRAAADFTETRREQIRELEAEIRAITPTMIEYEISCWLAFGSSESQWGQVVQTVMRHHRIRRAMQRLEQKATSIRAGMREVKRFENI